MVRTLPLAAAAAAIVLPALASAQTPPPQGRAEATRDVAIARAADRFAQMDANHDGAVTKDELQAYMAARMAARGDGAERHGGGMGGIGGMGAMMFDRFDTNHDGRITLDEAKADAAARFDQMDTNHDGVLSPDERAAGRGWGGRGSGSPQ